MIVNRGDVSNTTPDKKDDYLDTPEFILRKNELINKPHLISNGYEAAIFHRKSTENSLM